MATKDLIDDAQRQHSYVNQEYINLVNEMNQLQIFLNSAIASINNAIALASGIQSGFPFIIQTAADNFKLVHDDLITNGNATYNDGVNSFIAAPVDPDTYSLTPIRVA